MHVAEAKEDTMYLLRSTNIIFVTSCQFFVTLPSLLFHFFPTSSLGGALKEEGWIKTKTSYTPHVSQCQPKSCPKVCCEVSCAVAVVKGCSWFNILIHAELLCMYVPCILKLLPPPPPPPTSLRPCVISSGSRESSPPRYGGGIGPRVGGHRIPPPSPTAHTLTKEAMLQITVSPICLCRPHLCAQ